MEREYFKGSIKVVHNMRASRERGPEFLSLKNTEKVRKLHHSIPEYAETPLVILDSLAYQLGVKAIYVKDESHRFGLNAFKGLGGVYALCCVICDKLNLDVEKVSFEELKKAEYQKRIKKMVFATATDGNHGKGIAWAAAQFGCKARVYMPKGSSMKRAQAIREVGMTEVEITEMGYDDTVRYVSEVTRKNGWNLVQDTSWEGYEEIPRRIVQGYTTMAYEAVNKLEFLNVQPTHVFLQAGVGAMAGGVTGFLVNYYGEFRPDITIVEPEQAACIFESAQKGEGSPQRAVGNEQTIMAGLNCSEPCTITWPILEKFADHYVSCPDYISAKGMRHMAVPYGKDKKIISGESGAVTLGLLAFLLESPESEKIKREFGITKDSVILLFNTEGDTDPEMYRRIVYNGEFPALYKI